MDFKNKKISTICGDITRLTVDAIVNAANTRLSGGGGVDGAIHRAAGPGLIEECGKLGSCRVGEAKITKGYNLPASWVIHTVGPAWVDGQKREAEFLANCYRSCLALTKTHGISTLAFPSISTGRFRFPLDLSSQIAYREISTYLESYDHLTGVLMVFFDQTALTIANDAIKKLLESGT